MRILIHKIEYKLNNEQFILAKNKMTWYTIATSNKSKSKNSKRTM